MRLIALVSTAFGLFGTAASIYGVSHQLDPHIPREMTHAIALGLTVAGIALLSYATLRSGRWVALSSGRVVQQHVQRALEVKFVIATASNEFLKPVITLGKMRFGNVQSPFEAIAARHAINPAIVRYVQKRAASDRTVHGYYILYPLKARATRLMERGKILNAKHILPEHICRRHRDATSLYVGMLLADSRQASAFLLWQLRRDIEEATQRGWRIRTIFGRPETPDGRRLLKRNGFQPLSAGAEVWSRPVFDQRGSARAE